MKKVLSILLTTLTLISMIGCNGDNHQHNYTVKDTDEKYLAAEENCFTGRLYYYACDRCGKAGEHVWSAGDPLGHAASPTDCERCGWASTDSGTLESGHEWAYYNDGTLYLYGNGALPNWTQEQFLAREIPWLAYPISSIVLNPANGPEKYKNQKITAIGDYNFAGLAKLTSVTMPDYGVSFIGTSAFEGCSKLTELHLPASLAMIGNNAFSACTSIKEITIPKFTVLLNGNPFVNCTSLESISVADGNTAFTVKDGCLIELADGKLVVGTNQATIPTDGSVKSIGASAFEGNTKLTALHLPASVVAVEERAFLGCSGVTAITVDENNEIYAAQGNCLIEKSSSKLILGCADSVIPDDGSVTEIEEFAFADCSTLTALHIPETIKMISVSAFSGCSGIETITVANDNPTYHATNNCLIITNSKTLLLGCKTSAIPTDGSVIRIGNGAFAGTAILELTIPNAVTEIGEAAFDNCTKLEKITFGKGITTVDAKAFLGCIALKTIAVADGHKSLTVSNGSLVDTSTRSLLLGTNESLIAGNGTVTSIAPYAYACRTGLKTVFIPHTVTSIGEGAFSGCSELQEIRYQGSQEAWDTITLGNGWNNSTASELLIQYNAT